MFGSVAGTENKNAAVQRLAASTDPTWAGFLVLFVNVRFGSVPAFNA